MTALGFAVYWKKTYIDMQNIRGKIYYIIIYLCEKIYKDGRFYVEKKEV